MNKACLFLLSSMLFLLTGCWDEVTIEERGFVVGTSLDLAEEHSKDRPMITMTNQFVVPAGLGSPNEGGGETKPFTNLSISGQSLMEMTREMATIQGNAPFYAHLKLVVISEELARESHLLASIMDLLIRDPEMRRETRVVVSEQKAKDILEIESELEPLPAMHINAVNENIDRSGGLIEPLRIGELNQYMLEKSNYLIPRVVPSDGQMIFNGAGIFNGRNNQLIDIINGVEIVGVNLITGNLQGGFIKFEINDRLMVYELKNAKNNIQISADEPENITIDITIDTEGNIAEMFGEKSLLDKDYHEEIEKAVSENMEKMVSDIIKKGQDEIGMDFFGFSDIMQQKHYKTWKKIKDDWEEGENLFQNATINVTVNATVRTTGTIDRTKDQEGG